MERPVDTLHQRMQNDGHRPGDHRQDGWRDACGDVLPERVYEAVHDGVVLPAVDPREDRATRLYETHERLEPGLGIWHVMQYADRVDEVERTSSLCSRKRRVVDVALHHVRVRHLPDVRVRRVDGVAQVHAHYVASPVSRRVESVAAVAAAGVEHELAPEEVGLNRMDPVEKLRLVLVVELDELSPLPAKGGGRLLRHSREFRRKEAGHPVADRVAGTTSPADQFARRYLSVAVPLTLTQVKRNRTRWTREHPDQARLHPTLRATHRSDAPNGMSIRRRIGISDSKILRRSPFDHAGCRSFSVS